MVIPRSRAFTLAELLIALAILGVIATFTIPKVLQSQRNRQWDAIAKEAAATISGAYQLYTVQNQPDANTNFGLITPYLNYTKIDTTTTYDAMPGNLNADCASAKCLQLHNGSLLIYWTGNYFGGTGSTNAIFLNLDPDGRYSGGDNFTPGKSIGYMLYFNGAITSYGQTRPGTITYDLPWSGGMNVLGPNPIKDPDWFSWN